MTSCSQPNQAFRRAGQQLAGGGCPLALPAEAAEAHEAAAGAAAPFRALLPKTLLFRERSAQRFRIDEPSLLTVLVCQTPILLPQASCINVIGRSP